MTLLDNFPHTVKIERPKYTRDELGAAVPTLTSIATGVSAWVQNASSTEIIEFQKRDQRVTHRVLFCEQPALRVGDVVTVTASETDDQTIVGMELKFQALTDRSAGLGWMWRAMCEESDNPRYATFSGAT